MKIETADDAFDMLTSIQVDPYGVQAMLPKMRHLNIRIDSISCKVANIIKQEMLSLGGDAAVARGTVGCSIDGTDVLLMGTRKQYDRLMEKLIVQPFGLRELSEAIGQLLENMDRKTFILKTPRRDIVLGGRTLIMAVLNVTPDSFYDGGRYFSLNEAVAHGLRLTEEGADMIDIGGESSRPGADPVSIEEEWRRVIPVVEKLASLVDIPISVDTTKADIAHAAMAAGAEMINDISSMTFDHRMAEVVAETKAAVALMHMRGRPKTMQNGDLVYDDLMADILEYLRQKMADAKKMGISEERIVLDPGIGFGKTVEDNLRIIKHLGDLTVLGRPILMGVSRKSFIGRITGDETSERIFGTAAAVTAAVMAGSSIVRVHEVGPMKKVVALSDAIRGA
ncbi:MAG: dihydropteroate synthase [Syntrophus sp. SKADARSKE-3]|nr:dihydropteroate synthase [Syntrophus sp. SKADARSKE-3]